MKQRNRPTLRVFLTLGCTLLLVACGEKESTAPARGDDTASNEASPTILLKEAPAQAVPVGQARKEAEPGRPITVVGQIGGTASPIAVGYASFILADEDVAFCNETLDEHCASPWDACCEDPEKLAANRASVVFLDENGQPLPLDLKQAAGLTELDRVIVTGVVASDSNPDNLIIKAEGLYHIP